MKIKTALIILVSFFTIGQPKIVQGQTTGTTTAGTTTGGTTTTSATTTGTIIVDKERADNGNFVASLIALSPILLHIIILIWVWMSKMNIKEALSDKETIRQENAAVARTQIEEVHSVFSKSPLMAGPNLPEAATLNAIINAEESVRKKYLDNQMYLHNKAMRDGSEQTVRVSSVSRLIVFMAGHAAVAVGSGLASFIIYYMLITKPDAPSVPSLNGLVGVLLALGIGVVPYAVNRFTSSGNENPG